MSSVREPAAGGARDVLVLQHIACEPPGVYEDVLREHGARLRRVELDDGQALPDDHDYCAIVAMGGPMGAYDGDEHPWLLDEQRLLGAAVARGVPVFGVCLGAQQIAAALGARVWRADRPEVGVLDVSLTPAGRADPVFGALPGRLATLQWHGDTFELPAGAVLLASSPAFAHQAFRVGNSYALQFHLEVTSAMAQEWAAVPAYAASLESTLGPGALTRLLADFAARQDEMEAHARAVFTAWWQTATARPNSRAAGSPAA